MAARGARGARPAGTASHRAGDPGRHERGVHVRRAICEDAWAIATVHVRSWQGAYPGLVPQSYLDALRPEDRVEMWQEILGSTAWPHQGTFVVVDRGDRSDPEHGGHHDVQDNGTAPIIGFASMAPTRDQDCEPASVGELLTLYVDPDAWGRGGASRLVAMVLTELQRAGFAQASLWVLDTNARARRFYEHRGWRPDEASKPHDWGAFVATDVRYRIDLT
jgi:GNAT superfamily N-acetyltransferase